MRSWKQQRGTIVAVGVALPALLALTILQYHWVTQVSIGERERMQAGMEVGAARLRDDVNRELARVYLSFQIRADTVAARAWDKYARRYNHWNATAPYPRLVKDVYLVEINQRGRIRLSRFDPRTQRFEISAWPAALASVRQGYERAYPGDQIAGVTSEYLPEPVAGAVPALIIPMARQWTLTDSQAFGMNADVIFAEKANRAAFASCLRCGTLARDDTLFAHTIVLLNQPYLLHEFLPSLAQRDLAAGGDLRYNLTITSRAQPEQILYRSNPDAPSGVQSDVSINLLSVTFDELNRLLLTNPPEDVEAAPGSASNVAIGILGSGAATGAARQPAANTDDGQWRLQITHRAGSLEAAVNSLRLRNLLLSFGAALMLGAAVALLVISTQRAQRLAAHKLAFAAAISHELRTPLTVLSSAGANLADGIVHDPQHARRYGALIRSESRRLSDMVEQALAFAGIQSGRRTYTLRPVAIAEVIGQVLESCHSQLSEQGIVVESTIAPDLPPVLGEPAALRQAVYNLVVNAIKYSADDRWIGVRAAVVRGKRGMEIVITVRDRGLGIDRADLAHIWEPFYRGQAALDAQIQGSGLGLNLVQQVVAAHRGSVGVRSAPGQGSVFTVRLPTLSRTELLRRQAQEGAYEQTYFAR